MKVCDRSRRLRWCGPGSGGGLPMATAAIAGASTGRGGRGSHGERAIAALQRFAECEVGVGTVLAVAQAERAIAAGARFLFAPHWDAAVGTCCLRAGVPYIPGAFTPTEIWQAWEGGGTAVKVFPIQTAGGRAYLRCVRGVYPQIPLIPTGGVTRANATALLQEGAIAVGVAGDLFPAAAVQAQNWAAIAERCRTFLASLPAALEPG
ncbi:MAG: hypothetical protein HC918_07520 [Oscillatoriales cyanobacterium SM2_1_8]|nr:hypothetical protein [Oscillatoriales cyanobacterium SM2_1_8]